MDNKPRRANVGLDDVFGFRTSVFKASREMFEDGFAEDFVEFGSFDFKTTSGVNFGSEFKELGDVLSSLRAGD